LSRENTAPRRSCKTCGRGDAQEAYRKVAGGSAGRVVLRPQE